MLAWKEKIKNNPNEKKEIEERKKTSLSLIRNMGNMRYAVKNVCDENSLIPKRRRKEKATQLTHALSSHCKGYFVKSFLAKGGF